MRRLLLLAVFIFATASIAASPPIGGSTSPSLPISRYNADELVEAARFASLQAQIDSVSPSVDITAAGAIPNDGIDDTAAIQTVFYAATAVGKHVRSNGGTYRVDGNINMPSGLHLVDEGRTTVFDYSNQTSGNFMTALGTLGSEIPLAVAAQRHDRNVTGTTPHGAAVDDYYLLVSQRNALSSDSGDWQLGLATGGGVRSYFAEILQVETVTDTTSFKFSNGLVFPDYLTNNAAETPSTTRECTTVYTAPVTADATTTAGSNVVNLTTGDTSGIIVGMTVSGDNYAALTTVTAINSASQFTTYLTAITDGSTTLALSADRLNKIVDLTSGTTEGMIAGMLVTGTNIVGSTKVAVIQSPTRFTLSNGLAVTGAGATTLAMTTYPRASATIAKVNFAKDILIKGIKFIAGNGTNTIRFERTRDSKVEDCTFEMGEHTGTAVEFRYSYRNEGFNNTAVYSANSPSDQVDTHDPAYNPFKIVSSWYSGHRKSKTFHASQPFDMTYQNGMYPSMFLYLQDCETYHSKGNGATSHSGNYGALITGNSFINSSRGPAIRSRNTTFTNNIVTGRGAVSTYGIAIADGWVVDSIFSHNQITGFDRGIYITNASSQGVGFTDRRTIISSNIFRDCNSGVYSSYDNFESKTTESSGLIINNNLFTKMRNYGVYIDSYMNGVVVSDNRFVGPMINIVPIPRSVYFANNSVGNIIKNNLFEGLGSNAYAMDFGSVTDRDTFPLVDWPNRRYSVAGNIIRGAILGDFFDSNSIANSFEFGEVPSKRTWNASSGTSLLHETGNNQSMSWSMVTNNDQDALLSFGDQDAQYQGGFQYSNATNRLYSRAAGAYLTTLSSTYLSPYVNNALTLGDSTHKWSAVHATTYNGSGAALTDVTTARVTAVTGEVLQGRVVAGILEWEIITE